MKTLRALEISKLLDGLYRADHSLYLLVRGSSRSWTFVIRVNGTDLFKQRAPLMQAWADALLPL